jgi:hypothetical protein
MPLLNRGHCLLFALQGGYALCRVIKRHEAGLLQGEPAARAKGASNGGARGQMSKVPSNSSLGSSEQLSTFTSTTNSASPPPALEMSRGMCAVAESCNNFQVRYESNHCCVTGLHVVNDVMVHMY